jgi:SHAQKYF class myb-like DNA-binding protein
MLITAIDYQPKIIDQAVTATTTTKNNNNSNLVVTPRKPKTSKLGGGGRWSVEEHQAFLVGLSRYGREWKLIARDIGTRTSTQVRSHAQKVFAKYPPSPSRFYGPAAVSLSESVRLRAERILDDPAAAVVEVADTLGQLKECHRELLLLKAKKQQLEERLSTVVDAAKKVVDAETVAIGILRSFAVDLKENCLPRVEHFQQRKL